MTCRILTGTVKVCLFFIQARILHVTRGWHGSVFLGTCPTTVLMNSASFNTLGKGTAWHYACSKCSRLLWHPLLGHPGLEATTWLLGKDSGYRNHTPSTSTSTSELWPLWLGPTHFTICMFNTKEHSVSVLALLTRQVKVNHLLADQHTIHNCPSSRT